MSLTLKILLATDAFFALLLVVYLVVKYTGVFNRKPEFFNQKKENGEEMEVSYEEPVVPLKKEVKIEEKVEVKEEIKEEKLIIGSFEDLENQVKSASEK